MIPERATREPAGAVLSDDGKYRYLLWRDWSDQPVLTWIMYNPSTADAMVDDPTIRRCIGLSAANGYGGIEVVNLYAYRATDPREIARIRDYGGDVRGPRNHAFLEAATAEGRNVVCAWGSLDDGLQWRPANAWCFGKTKHGAPRHPLYLKADAKLERF